MKANKWELSPTELCMTFDPQKLPFETTSELPSEEGVIGQERAVRAMDFGLHMGDQGYNIYVSGVPGTGKSTIIKSMIKRVAEKQPTPGDWCYVNNFQNPDRPGVIYLPAGKGREFQRDMSKLIVFLKENFPRVFQSKEYQEERRNIEESFARERGALSNELDSHAKKEGFLIESSLLGISMIPLYKGKPIQADQIDTLGPEVREEILRKEKEVYEHIHVYVQKVREMREEMERKIESLNNRVARFSSEHSFETLREKHKTNQKILEYIQAIQQEVLENFKDFLTLPESPGEVHPGNIKFNHPSINRYSVNVIVDNSLTRGAPLIEEANPTYNNLVGQIEKKSQYGTLYTDFTLIKAGSLLQANGGYLVVDALDLLRQPFSWDALKRISKKKEIKIEDVGDLYGFITSSGIKPEPIPVRIRLILVGSPYLYYILHAYDEDFGKIFKVKVDFDVQQERKEESPLQYSRFIARLSREEGLLHFEKGGVGAVLEQVARWVDHQKKLSLRFSNLADLLRESSYWARQEGKNLVSRGHVLKAVQEKIFRSNLIEEYIRELIAEGSILVDLDGEVVGQVNGLSVHDLGDFSFGRPSRITARTFLGRGGVIHIDREAKLSGKTHNKGVLILSGYLGGRYARETPLSVSATIAFEQSYGEVDGDSASAAELVALLSSLSGIPLRQGIALTGSINQRGELQAIGGVNEKIEGFFTLCKTTGLTGKQGVIIPKQNIKNLMLREEVVAAAEAGEFHIYAAGTADEILEILTGKPAGELQADGTFPSGTVNEAVMKNLREMDEKMFGREDQNAEEDAPAENDLDKG
ncbi:MAG: AAA family ATPase [Nitrospirae bacterium]|nr:AAA family ATPase [Nitrospirota bacterium]